MYIQTEFNSVTYAQTHPPQSNWYQWAIVRDILCHDDIGYVELFRFATWHDPQSQMENKLPFSFDFTSHFSHYMQHKCIIISFIYFRRVFFFKFISILFIHFFLVIENQFPRGNSITSVTFETWKFMEIVVAVGELLYIRFANTNATNFSHNDMAIWMDA